jgi:hypothetical protein
MNCESCDEPKNSRTAAAAGFALIRSFGITVDDVDRRHALLDGALHAEQADAVLVFQQLADRTHTAVAEIVDVVDFALAVRRSTSVLTTARMSSLRSVRDGVLGVEVEAHVELDAADGREVVALRSKNSAAEHDSAVSSVGGSPGRMTR